MKTIRANQVNQLSLDVMIDSANPVKLLDNVLEQNIIKHVKNNYNHGEDLKLYPVDFDSVGVLVNINDKNGNTEQCRFMADVNATSEGQRDMDGNILCQSCNVINIHVFIL